MDPPLLTDRFEEALVYTSRLHANQVRKGSGTPYMAHLMAVAAYVIEDGGDEDMAIAALLHDAVEDQGGIKRLEEIQQLFGERVSAIVDGCTDSYYDPKPPWRQRKERYIDHLWTATDDVRRVSLSDKLHNASTLSRDLRRVGVGNAVWQRFNGGKEGTLWYYETLVKVFQDTVTSPLVAELERVVAEILQLAMGDQSPGRKE